MSNSNITDSHPEFLSSLAVQILQINPDAYRTFVASGGVLAPARNLLAHVTPEQLVSTPILAGDDGRAMLAGLWLWHDGLHECHEIAQDLIGPTGSFWHAIMHRREGDFSNAKYWYARCADHRAFRLISAMAIDVVGRETVDESILHVVGGEYNPEAFVDLVKAVQADPADPRRNAVIRLQQMEWEALFQHCAYEATGSEGGMI